MNITTVAPGMGAGQRQFLDGVLERKVERLERLLSSWRQDNLILRVHVEQRSHDQVFVVTLNMHVPHRALIARAAGPDMGMVVQEAFEDLEREAKSYKGRHRRSNVAHRKNEMLHAAQYPLANLEEEKTIEEFAHLLETLMPPLYTYALREVNLARLSVVDDAENLEPAEVVNQTVVRAYENYAQRPDSDHLVGWLYHLMHAVVEESLSGESSQHIEEGLPREKPAEWVSTEGDDRLDFRQPDDRLLVEDVLPDMNLPDPAHELDDSELSQIVSQELAAIPAYQRRVFILHMLEGFDPYEISMIQGRPEEQIRSDLEFARQALEQALSARWNPNMPALDNHMA